MAWLSLFSLNVRQSKARRPPPLFPAAMTFVIILASSRSFSPPGSLLPITYPCLGRLGVRAPSGNSLLFIFRYFVLYCNYFLKFRILSLVFKHNIQTLNQNIESYAWSSNIGSETSIKTCNQKYKNQNQNLKSKTGIKYENQIRDRH